jgi:hypothetical protein
MSDLGAMREWGHGDGFHVSERGRVTNEMKETAHS